MTEEKELRISLMDLTRVYLRCAACQAETLLDLTNKKHQQALASSSVRQPMACPVCHAVFNAEEPLRHFMNAQEGAQSVSLEVFFKLKRDSN